MPYQVPFQFLAPGAATMPEAGPVPFGAILQDKVWKTNQMNQLTADQAVLNDKFENILASNPAHAQLLKERKGYYEGERDKVLNDKNLTVQDKYRKVAILGNQAKNDPALQAVKGWTEDYQTNLKQVNEAESALDPHVQADRLAMIKAQNMSASGTPGENMAYAKYNNIKNINSLNLADDLAKVMESIRSSKTPVRDQNGRVMKRDNFGYLRHEDGTEVTEDEIRSVALGYVKQNPVYNEFFESKDRGAEIEMRAKLAAEGKSEEEINAAVTAARIANKGTVFNKDAFIEAGIAPGAQAYSYKNVDVNINQDWQQEQARAQANARRMAAASGAVYTPPPGTPVGTFEQNVETVGKGITNTSDYYAKASAITADLRAKKQKLLDHENGKHILGAAELNSLKDDIANTKADFDNLSNLKKDFRQAEIDKNTPIGFLVRREDRLKEIGVIDPKTGVVNPYAGKSTMINGVKYTSLQDYKNRGSSYFSNTYGNSTMELIEIGKNLQAGKKVSSEGKGLFSLQKQAMENAIGTSLSDYEFTKIIENSTNSSPGSRGPAESTSKNPKIQKGYDFLQKNFTDGTRSKIGGASEFEDTLVAKVKYGVMRPVHEAFDTHLQKNEGNLGTKSNLALDVITPLQSGPGSAQQKQLYSNVLTDIGSLDKYIARDENGRQIKIGNIKPDHVIGVGLSDENGKIPITVSYTKKTEDGTFQKTATILIDRRAHNSLAVGLGAYIRATGSSNESGAVERTLDLLENTTPDKNAFTAWIDTKKNVGQAVNKEKGIDYTAGLGTTTTVTGGVIKPEILVKKMPVLITNNETGAVKFLANSNPNSQLYTNLSKKYPQLFTGIPDNSEDYMNLLRTTSPEYHRVIDVLYKLKQAKNYGSTVVDQDSADSAGTYVQSLMDEYNNAVNVLQEYQIGDITKIMKGK